MTLYYKSLVILLLHFIFFNALYSQEFVKKMFDRLDKNEDGILRKEELSQKQWNRLTDFDLNGDLEITKNEFIEKSNENRSKKSQSISPLPTEKDLEYSSSYQRSKLDLWLPEGDANIPTPIVVWFHGGGFVGGNKSRTRAELFPLLDQGVAVCSVGYPLLKDPDFKGRFKSKEEGIQLIMKEVIKSIDYLKSNAESFQLDPEKIVISGSSAGCLIAEFLTYNTQLGISACIGIQQPTGTKSFIPFIESGEAPLFLFTSSSPRDKIHHPDFAKSVKDHCDQLGVECHLFGSEKSGLPILKEGINIFQYGLEVLLN